MPLIFSHKLNSSSSNWSVSHSKCNSFSITTFCHNHCDQKLFFWSFNDFISKFIKINGNSSFFFILLIVIKDITIFKSTKSSKSHIKSIFSFCHVINPWKSSFLVYSSKSINTETSIWASTPSMSSDNSQWCKHFTDSMDSVERRFRQSLNVNLALYVSVMLFKVISAKHSLHFGWHWWDRI